MIPVDLIDPYLLGRVRRKLKIYGYTDDFFRSLHVSPLRQSFIDNIKLSLRNKKNKRFILLRLFYLGMYVSKRDVVSVFNAHELDFLLSIGVLNKKQSIYQSKVLLYPYRDYYFVTDFVYQFNSHGAIIKTKESNATVFAPRIETEVFYDSLVHNKKNAVLDLGTGCGILAILSSRHNRAITGIDINPHAIHYASFNKKINNIVNVEFIMGNLFESLVEHSFDLIISNPPHGLGGSTANSRATNGGRDGQNVIRNIMKLSQIYLKKGGVLQLQVVVSKLNDESIIKLLGTQKYQGIFFQTLFLDIIDYASQKQIHHILDNADVYVLKMKHMIAHLTRNHVSSLSYGVLALLPSKKSSIHMVNTQGWSSGSTIRRYIQKSLLNTIRDK